MYPDGVELFLAGLLLGVGLTLFCAFEVSDKDMDDEIKRLD